MKRFFAAIIASLFFVPAFAAADSYGIQPTLGQLLSRIAALEAILANKQVSCAVTATKSTVKTGEEFTIAWGSYGADPKYSNGPENSYRENGEQAVRLDEPQVRTYHFTFFGSNGQQAKCDQTITVLP